MEDRLLAEMTDFLERHGVAGMTASAVTCGGQDLNLAAGYADRTTGEIMTPAHRMLTGSVGKTFTAATALLLQHQSLLDLDVPISRWLGDTPWLARVANSRQLTMRSLLNHTSGIPDHRTAPGFLAAVRQAFNQSLPCADLRIQPEALVEFIIDMPPLFAVGDDYEYCETNYILAGLVIETVAGETLYNLVETFFRAPLGLADTEPANHRDLRHMAQGYSDSWGMGFPVEALSGGRMAYNPATEWAGGGFVSTAADLAHWAYSLYGGGALPSPCMALMRDARTINDGNGLKTSYGIGSYIWEGAWGCAIGHGGEAPGYRSVILYLDEARVALGVQINSSIVTSPEIRDFCFRIASVVEGGLRP